MASTKVEYLPYGTVFTSKHSTAFNHRIAENNLLVLFEAGSSLHGTRVSIHADYDLYGVCVEPPEVALAADTPFTGEYHYRSVPVGHKSGRGDVDCNVYGLHKWAFETAKGNFNHLLTLFVPQYNILRAHPLYSTLREHRELFLARSHAKRIQGYLRQQRRDIHGQQRPDLIAKYGYDTKAAYHALRIALQGRELMERADIAMPLCVKERKLLIEVRNGGYELAEMMDLIAEAEKELVAAAPASLLPEEIDYPALNAWLSVFYQQFWESR